VRFAPWPPPGAGEQMDSSDRGRSRWPYESFGDGTQSDQPEAVVVVLCSKVLSVANRATGRAWTAWCGGSPAKGDGGCALTSGLTAQSGPGENERSCLPKHPCRWPPVNGCGITRRLRPRR
jgi:hypothetical protein